MKWEADGIQAVIFTPPGVHQNDAITQWGSLFPGDSPDSFQKAAASSPTLNSAASGEREGYAVSLNVQVGRIDLNVGPTVGIIHAATPESPPRMSDVRDVVHKTAALANRIIAAVQPIRIAIVLDLAVTVPYGNELATFVEALPEIPLPAAALEPTFQLNVRRPFNADPSIRMNRLCYWTTGTVGFMQAFQGPKAVSNVQMTPFVGYKIDCNTAPEDRIASGTGDVLMAEAVAEALALYEGGYSRLLNG
jgi:hypothetical protein